MLVVYACKNVKILPIQVSFTTDNLMKNLSLSHNNYQQSNESRTEETFQQNKTKRLWMLTIPITTFCLGCWQWKRHLWKTNLLRDIHKGMNAPPIDFPVDDINALDQMEYCKVHIRGKYLYEKQFVIKWRRRLDSAGNNDLRRSYNRRDLSMGNYGAQVITPLQIDGTSLVIMVNRGWIPYRKIETELDEGIKRQSNNVEFDAIVRKSQKPHLFMRNQPEKGIWVYRDLQQMASLCDAEPILVDTIYKPTDEDGDGPIGGQTNANLRNEHLSYMFQWFGICAATLFLWSLQFF